MKWVVAGALSLSLIQIGISPAHAELSSQQFNEKQKPQDIQKNNQTRVVVQYKDGKKPLTFSKSQTSLPSNVESGFNNSHVLTVNTEDVDSVIASLKSNSTVELVEEEIILHYTGTVNDSHYKDYQRSDFYNMAVDEAWETYAPSYKPTVAVLDSGVLASHEDLKGNLIKVTSTVEGQNGSDKVGHGTHVAGTVGAITNNSKGVASASKGVKLMSVQVGNEYGISSIDLAEGIYYAVDNGADIINISIGGPSSSYTEKAVRYAQEKGVLIVSSAGNDNTSYLSYPAAYPEVMSVAALDSYDDTIAPFSNYGSWVDVAAPGVDILSSTNDGSYGYASGTSMASPNVTSVAAMLKASGRYLSGNQIRYLLEVTSRQFNGDEYIGHGAIDAKDALAQIDLENRVFGASAIHTSVEISQLGFEGIQPSTVLEPNDPSKNSSIKTEEGTFAVIGSSDSFADSLSSSALAYQLNAPILLTNKDKILGTTTGELQRLGVTDVILLGGEAAISSKVEKELKNKRFNVIRLAGASRYSTSQKINEYIAKTGGEVFVTSGDSFADSLSASVYAAKLGIPIVFVKKDQIPKETQAFLNKYKFSKAYVIGGEAVISKEVAKELPNAERIAGPGRYSTNTRIIEKFSKGETPQALFTATGTNYKDALAGGVVAAKLGYSLLLVDPNKIDSTTENYVNGFLANSSSPGFLNLGGKGAVSSKVVWELDNLIYGDLYSSNYTEIKQTSKSTEGQFNKLENTKKINIFWFMSFFNESHMRFVRKAFCLDL
ncbi:S8 family serine peptidase [Bacillus coahuilensis]|uniref:S8 family serine peptidase n=1 Tax=Bacillus coahuilensis TaxID=408580 RepID=UPI001ED90079|nr:S8 family serine peptidase [Bacillus coahuilensis]